MSARKPVFSGREYSERRAMGRMVTIIQPTKKAEIKEDRRIRVAAYARVSKDSESQEDSYISQKKHAEEVINRNPDWTLTRIYADQASGLNTKKRTEFNKMIEAAKCHEMDLILVKSISRFGRSVVDTLTSLRTLEKCGTRVYFDRENMYSDDLNCNLVLSIMASMAESESLSISANVRTGQKYKAEDGRWSVAYGTFLGYDKAEEDTVVINEEQAKTVRFIFSEFLSGTSLQDLCRRLEKEGHRTGTGSTHWTKTGVRRILSNIKYSGDVIQGLTYTADVMEKNRKRNNGDVPLYYIKDGIPAIIDRQTYLLAKGELLRREAEFVGKTVEGPAVYNRNNDFTHILACPECGAFFNRIKARGKYVWKCYNRRNADCKAEIIREKELQAAVLSAAQELYDLQPEITERPVPVLSNENPDEELILAAGINAYNSFADRLKHFLAGERPEHYDPEISRRLIRHITFTEDEWVFLFYGDQTVRVPRKAKE